jgi:site-specific recombinase XerD
MTRNTLYTENATIPKVIDRFDPPDAFEDPYSHFDLDTYLEALGQSEPSLPSFEDTDEQVPPARNRAYKFERIMKKLNEMEVPGKDYIEQYLHDQHRRYLRINTMRNALSAIGSFLTFFKNKGGSSLEQITRRDLEAFIEHEQDRGVKASTVRTRMKSLRPFILFLIEQGIVQAEVLFKRLFIKVPEPLPRAMDPDDERKLLSVIDHVRDRAMILVLLRTGMRIGELLNTRVWEVNLKERVIEIHEAEKTRVGRVVYLSDDACDALRAWFRVRDAHKSFLFYAQGRNTITYSSARHRFVKYLEKAGLAHKGYSLHCLRHTCATELLNAGMPLECVQLLLGHSSIEMTRRYAKLTDRTRKEEYFKAMGAIERGETDGHYELDRELQTILEEKELLGPHDQELHE